MISKWIIIMAFNVMGFDGGLTTKELGLGITHDSRYICETRMESSIPEWMEHYKNEGGYGDVQYRCMEIRMYPNPY